MFEITDLHDNADHLITTSHNITVMRSWLPLATEQRGEANGSMINCTVIDSFSLIIALIIATNS